MFSVFASYDGEASVKDQMVESDKSDKQIGKRVEIPPAWLFRGGVSP
jgi:hypothetical protein